MCGIPFSGKSTLAREIACYGGFSLVSVDRIVCELDIDLGAEGENQRGWARAMAEAFQRSRGHLADGISVVYDNANHTRRNRDRCRRLAAQVGARIACVWIDVDPDTAYRRLLENRKRPTRSDVPDAAFRQIVEEFEQPTDEPDVVHWRPGMNVDELVGVLKMALPQGRHGD